MLGLDGDLYRAVNGFARDTGWLHPFFEPYALWGGPVLIVLLLVLAWWRARSRPEATYWVATSVLTGVGAVVAVLANQHLISPAIARVRPCAVMPHAEVLLTCTSDYSMPSDHCMIAGAMAAGLWLLSRRLGAVATALAVLLAFGRVYVGVHYPSDTVVGLLLGAAIGLVVIVALRPACRRLAELMSRGPLRPLVVAGRH